MKSSNKTETLDDDQRTSKPFMAEDTPKPPSKKQSIKEEPENPIVIYDKLESMSPEVSVIVDDPQTKTPHRDIDLDVEDDIKQ